MPKLGDMTMTKSITTPDDVRIAYHELGAGDPAIIFVHGGFGDRTGFGLQEEYFAPNHRCISVDLRGHGESDKPDQVYTMEQHGDDVAELIRQLGLEKPVLVGQSMGGQVIISAAARHPDVVGAIASLDSPSNIPGWHAYHHGPYDHLMQEGQDIRKALEQFLSAAHLPTDDPTRAKNTSERLARLDDRMILNGWKGMMVFDTGPVLAGVKCPYLYVDCGQPRLDLDLLRELCPQVVIGKPVGAGHGALRVVPDQINAMLRRFIEHADAIAAEMVRTGGVFQYTFPDN